MTRPMNSEAMQKPNADERADDANRRVADETKPVAPNNLASQPSGDDPNNQNDKQPLVRQMHALPSALRPDSRTSRNCPRRSAVHCRAADLMWNIERRKRANPFAVRGPFQRFFAGARFLRVMLSERFRRRASFNTELVGRGTLPRFARARTGAIGPRRTPDICGHAIHRRGLWVSRAISE